MSEQPKQDRHSKMAVDGKPKKGGAGKGGWGIGGADDLKELDTDHHDPLYDSSDETEDTLATEKNGPNEKINAITKDFLLSGDLKEAVSAISEAHFGNHANLIRKLMVTAMEKTPFERELASQLIANLRLTLIPEDQYDESFQRTLNRLPEICIDVPQGVDMLGKFLARAVLDEVVSPSFVRTCNLAHIPAEECVNIANSLINQKHRIHRISHIWGPGDMASIKRLKAEIDTILKEYIESGDAHEAQRSLISLSVRHFHFQFVKRSVRIAVGGSDQDRQKISALLSFLHKSDVIGNGQMRKGFECVEEELDDIKLDSPKAPANFQEIRAHATAEHWLDD